VRELLGGVGPEALVETTYALSERRAADALLVVDRLSNEGKDLGQFVVELLAHLRNLMLLPHAPEAALAGVGAEERGPLEEQAAAVPTAEVVRLVDALGDSLSRVRRGGDPKLELELSFLKLTRDYTEPDLTALLSRMEALERAIENGDPVKSTPSTVANAAEGPREAPQPVEPEPEQDVSEPEGPSREVPVREEAAGGTGSGIDLAAEWVGIMGELKRRRQALTAAVYGEARVEDFDGHVLRLVYPEEQSFHVGMARERAHTEKLCSVLEERLGSVPRLEVRAAVGESAAPVTEEPPPAPTESPAPEPRADLEGPPPETGGPNGVSGPEARNPDPGPQATAEDGVIRNEHEVFEIAREQEN
jgi:DNA polymerase-3 subunit gamma/tau